MRTSKKIHLKDDMTWQMMRKVLLEITDDNGIVDKAVVAIAKKHKFWRWSKIGLIFKRGDVIFNGKSNVHINKVSKNIFNKYINFEYPEHKGYQAPVYVKDAKDMTVTVVPTGKEKEFIEKNFTKKNEAAYPKQLKTFSLLWGLLKFNY